MILSMSDSWHWRYSFTSLLPLLPELESYGLHLVAGAENSCVHGASQASVPYERRIDSNGCVVDAEDNDGFGADLKKIGLVVGRRLS